MLLFLFKGFSVEKLLKVSSENCKNGSWFCKNGLDFVEMGHLSVGMGEKRSGLSEKIGIKIKKEKMNDKPSPKKRIRSYQLR